jgi:peptidoglycan/LPS O-acetylase OafA/YrhL
MIDAPDVNRLADTSLLIAGVTWTLAYEWLFYLSLPLSALVLSRRVAPSTVAFSTALLLLLVLVKTKVYFPWSFVIGAVGAFVARSALLADRLRGPVAAVAVVAALGWAILWQDVGMARASTAALIVVFIPVACGNAVFGVLTNRAALLLGEISYGLYLLHGLLLTALFSFVFGVDRAKSLSPLQHWSVIGGAAIALVLLASVAFKTIEQPAMRSVRGTRDWLFAMGLRLARGKAA